MYLFLKKYILFLADVFEDFICTCLKFYKQDPFQKVSDIEVYLFIEKGLRGGISYIAKIC